MAVAFVTNVAAAQTTAASYTITISVSGTNPVLIVCAAINTDSPRNVTDVSSDINGAFSKIIDGYNTQDSVTPYTSLWALKAPTAGSHTITVTNSVSVASSGEAVVFSGADQANPCPTGDAQFDGSTNSNTIVLTPTNLTASDATYGGAAASTGGVPTSSPNQLSQFLGSFPVMSTGYATGTTGLTSNLPGGAQNINHAVAATRIVAASGVAIPTQFYPSYPDAIVTKLEIIPSGSMPSSRSG